MTSISLLIILMIIATWMASYADSQLNNNIGGTGSSGGYGFGYTGNFPNVFPQHPINMNNFLAGYLNALQQNFRFLQANSNSNPRMYTYTSVSLDPGSRGMVMAQSHLTFHGLNQIQAQAQNANVGGFAQFPNLNGRAGGFGAGASASVDQNQVHQQAFLNPENPKSPNVNVRYSVDAQPGSGFYGISSSSSGFSSDINGKRTQHRQAETVVNRNGQVTRYVVND